MWSCQQSDALGVCNTDGHYFVAVVMAVARAAAMAGRAQCIAEQFVTGRYRLVDTGDSAGVDLPQKPEIMGGQ